MANLRKLYDKPTIISLYCTELNATIATRSDHFIAFIWKNEWWKTTLSQERLFDILRKAGVFTREPADAIYE